MTRDKQKITVFLGGVINVPNAQNNNCLSLLKKLNTDKYDLIALQSTKCEINSKYLANTILISKPVFLHKYWAFLKGIIKSDICYFPKTECMTWNRLLCKVLGRKYFRTVESIFDRELVDNINKENRKYIISDYHLTDNLYSITNYMKDFNLKEVGFETKEKILYLGVDDSFDYGECRNKKDIKDVILIGNDLIRKGVKEYISLSRRYQGIKFHIVGSGNGKVDIESLISKESNVTYHGRLSTEELQSLLNDIDLLILPSHSEGFPKVILECAGYSIPSLIYSSYGAGEWMTTDVDGYIVDNYSELESKFEKIANDNDKYLEVRAGAYRLYKNFTWNKKIELWESVIDEL